MRKCQVNQYLKAMSLQQFGHLTAKITENHWKSSVLSLGKIINGRHKRSRSFNLFTRML